MHLLGFLPLETPNPKLQTPEKLQTPNTKVADIRRTLELEAWGLLGIWCLGFGVSIPLQSPIADSQ